MELIYLHTQDNMLLGMDEVFKKPAIQFLYVSEYLIKKKEVEYNESKAEAAKYNKV